MPPENKCHCLLMLDDQKSQYIIPSNWGNIFILLSQYIKMKIYSELIYLHHGY